MEVKFESEEARANRTETAALELRVRQLIEVMIAERKDPRLIISAATTAIVDLVVLLELSLQPGIQIDVQVHWLVEFRRLLNAQLAAASKPPLIVRPS